MGTGRRALMGEREAVTFLALSVGLEMATLHVLPSEPVLPDVYMSCAHIKCQSLRFSQDAYLLEPFTFHFSCLSFSIF